MRTKNSTPAETTIVTFDDMNGRNSRTDCGSESAKTSLEDSNRSDEYKKVQLYLKVLKKMQILDFPEVIF